MNAIYLQGGRHGIWTTDAIQAVRGLREEATYSEIQKAFKGIPDSEFRVAVDELEGRYDDNGVTYYYSNRSRWVSPLGEALTKGLSVVQAVLQRGGLNINHPYTRTLVDDWCNQNATNPVARLIAMY